MADATATTFNFDLVSPEKILVSEPAWQVLIPGEEGYFGVRAAHMSLIAAVRPGVVEVFAKEGDMPRKIFIAGGFADVTANNVTLLAEQATDVSQLDTTQAESELAALRAEQAAANDMPTKMALDKRIRIAAFRVEAAKSA